jgi:hypothetical protein
MTPAAPAPDGGFAASLFGAQAAQSIAPRLMHAVAPRVYVGRAREDSHRRPANERLRASCRGQRTDPHEGRI